MSVVDPDLYLDCLDHHREACNLDFIVGNSLPVPYFGDVAAYARSSLKVLTAALNPSSIEFPTDNPRFDIARGLNSADELEAELSNYFKRNPYCKWFRSFERVLNGADASYGSKMADSDYRHTALHVDMCSPLATSPKWSKLTPDQRGKLTTTGREIFRRLVEALKPNMIIASLAWSHIEDWPDFQTGRSWSSIRTYETTFRGSSLRTPLLVQANIMKSRGGHVYFFANGSAANTPFGRFHNQRKQEVGARLLHRLTS